MAKFEMQPLQACLFDYIHARIQIVHDKSQRVNVALADASTNPLKVIMISMTSCANKE